MGRQIYFDPHDKETCVNAMCAEHWGQGMRPDRFLFLYVVKGTVFMWLWTGHGGVKAAQKAFTDARQYVFDIENIERLPVVVLDISDGTPTLHSRYIMKKPEPGWVWSAVAGYPEDRLS